MKDIRTVIPIIFVICLILVIQLRAYYFERELSKNGKFTLGRIDSIEKNTKTSYLHVSYYINNKKYSSFESRNNKGVFDYDIGNFYYIKYLKSSPDIFRGDYSKRVTDTAKILNAGFSKEDIGK